MQLLKVSVKSPPKARKSSRSEQIYKHALVPCFNFTIIC
jgi:hypothetical protein